MTRRALVLIGAIVAAALAYSAWWVALARGAVESIGVFVEARRAEGWTVAHGPLETSGYPFRLIVSMPDVAVESTEFAWRGPMLRGVAKPWDFGHVILTVEGRQNVSLGAAGRRIAVEIEAARALASLRHVRGVVGRFDAELREIGVTGPDLAGRLAAERAEVHVRTNSGEATDRPAGTLDIAATATGATIPPGTGGILGDTVASVSIDGRLVGQTGTTREALGSWRDGGGTVELRKFAILWGPLDATLDATLALDKDWRPMGAGVARARGYGKTIDAALAARLIRPVEAELLRLALAVRAKRDENPEPYVEMPVTAQDGRVFIGPAPVARLPPIF